MRRCTVVKEARKRSARQEWQPPPDPREAHLLFDIGNDDRLLVVVDPASHDLFWIASELAS
jgi:hypothetical protein